MSLFQAFLAALGSFALLQFAFIPWLNWRFEMDRSVTAIARAATVATLGYARSVLLIAAATTAGMLLVLLSLQLLGGTTIEGLEAAISTLQAWRGRIAGFGPMWGGIALVLLVVALGAHARRSGKSRMERIFRRILDREWERVRQERAEGRLEELPPTVEIEYAENEIERLTKRRDGLLAFEGESPGRAELIEEISKRIAMLQRHVESLDIARRIELRRDGEPLLRAPRSGWETLESLLFSRGLLLSLGAGSRLLHLVGLILLVPSLMGICSPAANRVLDNHEARLSSQLDDLSRIQVFKNVADAKTSLEHAMQQLAAEAHPLSAQDDEILRSVSVQFERALASSRVWGNILPQFAPAYEFRSLSVRDKILSRFAEATGQPVQKHPAMANVAQLTPVERETTQIFDLASGRGPTSSAGKALHSELRAVASRSPSFVDKVRAGLHGLTAPASREELSSALFRRVAEMVVDPEAGPLGELVRRKFDVPSLRNAMGQYQEATRRRFVADLLDGHSDLPAALNRVRTADGSRAMIPRPDLSQFKNSMRVVYSQDLKTVFAESHAPVPGTSQVKIATPVEAAPNSLMGKLRNYPPSVDEIPSPDVGLKKASTIAVTMEGGGGSGTTRPFSNPVKALREYPQIFPAQLGAEKKFPLIKITGSKQIPEPSALKFGISRDFSKLRGFPDNGGVLIGRPQSAGSGQKCDFIDFKWETEGPRLRLILVSRDGQIFRSRPHQVALIRQALAYAADGRPVAVTIIPAPPLLDLKVLLHPVLVDTLLGGRMIDIDQFVFEYTGAESFHIEARNKLDAQMALYAYAWATRVRSISEHLSKTPRLVEEWRKPVNAFKELAKRCLDDRELAAEAGHALKEPRLLSSPDHSPLTVKEKFFDKELVAMIIESVGSTSDMDLRRFGERLSAKTEDASRSLVRSLESAVTQGEIETLSDVARRWFYQFPSFEITGGVRETPFGSSPADVMMVDGEDAPVPLEFTLQVAFTSNALLNAMFGGDEKYSSADDDPWEFPSIKKAIHSKVTERIRADNTGRDDKIVSEVSEFVMLQRLFRTALSGDLGADFPVEKLVDLTQAATKTKPSLAFHTLRWDSYPGQLELLLEAQINRCLKMIDQLQHESQKEYISPAERKRFLEKRLSFIDERVRSWADFREGVVRCVNLGSDPSKLWDDWENWDKRWQENWARLGPFNLIVKKLGPVDVPDSIEPDDNKVDVWSLKEVLESIDDSISALEMRHALGVSRDDRNADLQRVRRVASWRRLMGAVARSGLPQA